MTEKNTVKIASLGGIEVIISAMSTHSDDSGVQENACYALCNLAFLNGMFYPLPYWSTCVLSDLQIDTCMAVSCSSSLFLSDREHSQDCITWRD